MTKLALLAIVLAACSGKPKPAPAKPEKPVATAPQNTPPPDPACTDATTKLSAWLTDLAADGHPNIVAKGLTLASLADAHASAIPAAPAVIVKQEEITFQGKLVAADLSKSVAAGKALADALKAAPAGKDVMFVIDGLVPWAAVVALANAAAGGGRAHATFVFAAGAPPKVSAPGPSAIDNDLLLATTKHAADLAKGNDGGIPKKVFAKCAPVLDDLFPKLSKATDRDAMVVAELPKAIAACSCKVEMASVQRLLWTWWDRDEGVMMTSVTVDIDKAGTPVKLKRGTWGDGSAALVTAAKAGKPIALQ